MAEKRGLTNMMLENFEKMVRDELQPLQTVVEAVEERLRLSTEKELKEELGLNAILARKKELERELEDVNEQLERVVKEKGHHSRFGNRDYGFYDDGSTFGKEVAARMATANGVIGAYREMEKRAIREVRLVDAPAKVSELLSKLTVEVGKMLGTAQDKLKELPAPRTEDDEQREHVEA